MREQNSPRTVRFTSDWCTGLTAEGDRDRAKQIMRRQADALFLRSEAEGGKTMPRATGRLLECDRAAGEQALTTAWSLNGPDRTARHEKTAPGGGFLNPRSCCESAF
jgi:hypothetical protein